jgi:hypothetical protein
MEAFKKLSRPRGRVPRQACAWHPIEVCCQDEMRVDQKNKLTYCWARKGSRAPSTISAPNQPICSVRFAPNTEPAPPWFCLSATPKLCSFISTRLPQKSPPAPTRSSFSIKPAGTDRRTSRYPDTYRSCSCRRGRPSSTAKRISGNSCDRIGCRTESSNPSTTSSITAAMPGTRSSISPGKVQHCWSAGSIGTKAKCVAVFRRLTDLRRADHDRQSGPDAPSARRRAQSFKSIFNSLSSAMF